MASVTYWRELGTAPRYHVGLLGSRSNGPW
jgi:hypothetical protein